MEHVGWVALAGLIGFLGDELVAIYRIRVCRSIGSAALSPTAFTPALTG